MLIWDYQVVSNNEMRSGQWMLFSDSLQKEFCIQVPLSYLSSAMISKSMIQSLHLLNDQFNIWDLIFKKKPKYLIHKFEEIQNLKDHIGDWILMLII